MTRYIYIWRHKCTEVRGISQTQYSANETKKPPLSQEPLQHHLCKQLLHGALGFFPSLISAACTLSSLLSVFVLYRLCSSQSLFPSHSIQQIRDTRPNTVFQVTNEKLFWVIFFAEVEISSLFITGPDDLSIQEMDRATGSNGITKPLSMTINDLECLPNTSLWTAHQLVCFWPHQQHWSPISQENTSLAHL